MIKIVSAHQPAYLPWLGFFHKIALADDFVVLDNVQFEKNSFINRNKIKTPDGPLWLTVPVLTAGHTRNSVYDIKINNSVNWKSKHWKSICLNYRKATYFAKFSGFFEDMFLKDWERLCDLLDYSFQFFINELGIKARIHKQRDLNISGKKQELIFDLVKHFGANVFVFGALGKEYADVSYFEQNSIIPYFQDYRHPDYPQSGNDFIPNLSVIDILFNVGKERAGEIIMEGNITNDELRRMTGAKYEKNIGCGSAS
jgi:hypothetical protein